MTKPVVLLATIVGFAFLLVACEPTGTGADGPGTTETTPTAPPADPPADPATSPVDPATTPSPSP
ncbi:hypothetical protein [Thermocoleostomius sinensis]|uniref:Uncharacterized protein n=1 Tax=Thermocoleostomius sinensis A174 TaxID=2016057 RepID=A0A9E8ZCR9_9CYAN|nr:hypothetical protein [Thermocoleostomius sinensis]WAL59457.1 hypothetical protein OXH18_20125 [Thermocoleostomius sinensis A174]